MKLGLAALMLFCAIASAHSAIEPLKRYNAIIRNTNGTTAQVSIEAKNYFEAKDQIPNRYCGGDSSCIVEGPWEAH
jgi:hypothetical protein